MTNGRASDIEQVAFLRRTHVTLALEVQTAGHTAETGHEAHAGSTCRRVDSGHCPAPRV